MKKLGIDHSAVTCGVSVCRFAELYENGSFIRVLDAISLEATIQEEPVRHRISSDSET
jgi:hypothetical protein